MKSFAHLSAVLAGAVLLLFLTGAAMAADGSLKITEMAVTTKISRNNPIDSVKRISSTSVKALYCFTRLVNPSGTDTTIKHRWFKNGELVSEQELSVKGTKWRTWSKKPIDRQSVGEWRVEAVDDIGRVLKRVEFKIN
ncbi:hypothetical protein GURASL_26210 [Geotalea uraniireducens]|uniref:DUF2914 domain-containing protein n=2 Tax=Geotalea uraniireducens TaxID=351604 RepID=A0ABM8ENA9_9BACT|nr:hypothetical protein GURASL_26210 [Geotalea uraniireducens]